MQFSPILKILILKIINRNLISYKTNNLVQKIDKSNNLYRKCIKK